MVAVAAFAAGCARDKCEDLAPTLEFIEYAYVAADPASAQSADTLTLRFHFSDCQGDVGILGESELRNLQTTLHEQIKGEWVRFVPEGGDTTMLFSQVPGSSKVKQGEKVEGIIVRPFGSIRQNSDTIHFEVRLLDREGHASAAVYTPTFVFPKS